MRTCWRVVGLSALLWSCAAMGQAQPLPAATAAKIDEIAAKALSESGTPSVSIAVARGGKVVFEKAYGKARLEPATDATPQTRYSIGSVSKQFLATCVLLLVQDGKLSLDDRVAKYLPSLTRAGEITVRQLLNHTSGYQDYYPQDYVPTFMEQPVTPEGILDRWARKPLDFDPGTRWQYSNTGYVVAGRIVEKASGEPFFAFLSKRILQPLGLRSAIDLDAQQLGSSDATGYTRFATAPQRPVRPEAHGWVFAAGELAMTAHDLAVWDVSLIERKLLRPASWEALTTPVRLRNGTPTSYALGVTVANAAGHPKLSHGGAVAGFVSLNTVWPEQGVAVVVLGNLDGSSATGSITGELEPLLVGEVNDPGEERALSQAKEIFEGLKEGRVDRALLSPGADAFFKKQTLEDAASSLKSLGAVESFKQTGVEQRGGMTHRHFRIEFKEKSLRLDTLMLPDGKLEQYLIQ